MFSGDTPRHFLSYVANNQRTLRELAGSYDGILVPGTVAALQREGTAGFALSLSATEEGPSYVVDPRFPLFQQSLGSAKQSHKALADLFNDPGLITNVLPRPQEFDGERVKRIAEAWVKFNLQYRTRQSVKFKKYAERLGEELSVGNAKVPQRVLAPYFCVKNSRDPWWEVSLALYEATLEAAKGEIEVTRVLAAQSPFGLNEIVGASSGGNVCIWVSDLNELNSTPRSLADYGLAIAKLYDSECRSFALYGGFFAVTLSAVGLHGFSHGIGYGDNRNWSELPRSGRPPARYYLPTVHRYVSQEEAQQLWQHDPLLISREAVRQPINLNYHELMIHSVSARSQEIKEYGSLDLTSTIDQLESEWKGFLDRINSRSPNRLLARVGERLTRHLPVWIEALKYL